MINTTHDENADPAQAAYEGGVCARVAVARADTRKGMGTDQLRQLLQARTRELHDDPPHRRD